mgnify:CR=1 FL=1
MRYRQIGDTGVTVSEVGFGVWTVSAGWWGEYSDEDASRLMHAALERGVTFFDTADTYGQGRGETVMKHAFPGSERDQIVIGARTPVLAAQFAPAPHFFFETVEPSQRILLIHSLRLHIALQSELFLRAS